MSRGQGSGSVQLALVMALAGSWIGGWMFPAQASPGLQPASEQREGDRSGITPTPEDTDEGKATLQPITNIPRINDRAQPATTVKDWVAQIEAATVQVTGVKLEPTDTGLDIVLETADGKPLQVDATKFRSEGNSLIADIPNAVLVLPEGQAFAAENPTEEIAIVQVVQQEGGSIRVSVTGKAGVPTEEVTLRTGEFAYSLNPEAEEPDEAIEIVVTGEGQDGYRVPNTSVGTRTDTPIRDIPASVQVIPRQVLEDQRVTQVREALTNVSGVTAGSGGSQTATPASFIFRGFQTDRDNLFVNGFRRYNFLNRDLEVANIEQLEILKGPASVLYGQGEPGGILNITTKQPLSTPFYGVEATIGNFSFITGLQADNRTVNRNARFDDDRRSNNYFLQTDVIGKVQTGTVKHDLLFGVEVAWLNDRTLRFTASPPLPPIDLFNPNYDRPAIRPGTVEIDQTEYQNLIGVYAQNLISIADNLKILLGGRFDFAYATRRSPVFLAARDISNEIESTAFSPRVGIVYQPIPPISLYGSYSQSFQPSRANALNADNTPFDPEPTTGEAFEVGVKTEFLDGRLAATLAAYQITKQNIVVSDPNRPGFSLQVGEQRSRGIEFDIAGEILPGWKVIGSYTHIDAEITEDTRPAFKGNTPNNVPRNSASLWTTYEFQTGDLRGFGFGGGVNFVGDRQGDLANTFTLPSYARVDAALYYRRDNWQIGLNIKNLFNAYYFESANGRNSVYPGAPFTVLGTVSVQL